MLNASARAWLEKSVVLLRMGELTESAEILIDTLSGPNWDETENFYAMDVLDRIAQVCARLGRPDAMRFIDLLAGRSGEVHPALWSVLKTMLGKGPADAGAEGQRAEQDQADPGGSGGKDDVQREMQEKQSIGVAGSAVPGDAVMITEPALLIRIAQLYRDGMCDQELYDCTRGVWRVGDRRERAQIAFAVYKGIVLEVYAIDRWVPAGSTAYLRRPPSDVAIPGRWEFVGTPAPPDIRARYVGRSVAHYFPVGALNPIAYVNLD